MLIFTKHQLEKHIHLLQQYYRRQYQEREKKIYKMLHLGFERAHLELETALDRTKIISENSEHEEAHSIEVRGTLHEEGGSSCRNSLLVVYRVRRSDY